jgi:hypothetical protein
MPVYILTSLDEKEPTRVVIDALSPADAEGYAFTQKIGGEGRVWKCAMLPVDRNKLPPANVRTPFVICVGNKDGSQTVSATESTSDKDDVPEAELAGTDADESPDFNPDDFHSDSTY